MKALDEIGRFGTKRFPWLIGLGALAVYLLTLNRFVSLSSLVTIARVGGWEWQPNPYQPLAFAVLYPFRFLPASWLPLALNIFTAVCAALVMSTLARSVTLLSSARAASLPSSGDGVPLPEPVAWMPQALAAVACLLQLTFWEQATAATGEMLNLLVFAGAIWCLLEFRSDGRERWLSRGVFLYAAGMTNSWELTACCPVFIAGIIWNKRLGFFDVRFLCRMALWAFAGLSLFVLLPLV